MIRIFMLYENVYYMVFTRHSAGKIWSSICIQDNLYSRYRILYIIRLIRCEINLTRFCIRFI